jgi:hypothetical protein
MVMQRRQQSSTETVIIEIRRLHKLALSVRLSDGTTSAMAMLRQQSITDMFSPALKIG